ncbi:MAG: epoxyqueuosine reductase [Candidatus Omnitrophica bacterium]|nr:epoxyqueuosine reductase [Candidatus Omnitrophota bacterium]
MEKNKNYLSLKKLSLKLGADLFGAADISGIKNDFLLSADILKKIKTVVCLGLGLSRGVLDDLQDEPTRLYFHHYRTVNATLDQAALAVSHYIQKKGFLSIPIPASQIIDWQSQKAHLSHKKIGYLAGLGWIGRNNLLVNKNLGSQFRLVSILTDMPLKTGRPLQKDCGECRSCVRICPSAAIKDNPAGFDHQACLEKLKEFQKKRLVDQYICGLCVKACRGNRT